MAQRSPIHSWNRIGPSVVSAMKSGAASPSLSDMCPSLMRWCLSSGRGAGLAPGRNADDVIREARRGVEAQHRRGVRDEVGRGDRKSTRLNSSHSQISYAVFCLKKKTTNHPHTYVH